MSRRSMVAGLVLALVVAGVPSAGFANFYTAQSLKESCVRGFGAERLDVAKMACSGYIIGVSDSAMARRVVCAPDGASAGQVVDVARKYLNDHPEDGHYSAANIVEHALSKVWPCK